MWLAVKLVAVLVVLLAVAVGLLLQKATQVPPLPEVRDEWWGPGRQPSVDGNADVVPFKININDSVIDDLNSRLNRWRNPTKPLQNARFTYGMNTDYLQKVVTFWRTKYNWRQREAFLNSLPQFKTNIAGLDIHFIRAAPAKVPKGAKVLPLLLLHGWPGSVRVLYSLIPLLTAPREGHDFVFEVVAPSLPGFGFSDAAVRSGLGAAQIGLVMKKLMHRLGFDKFYVEAEDIGALVGSNMATLYPDVVLGAHMSLCPINHPMMHVLGVVGWFFPSLVVDEKYLDRVQPVWDKLAMFVEEMGYCHIQATKPDTVGVGLSDSPVGLAAYILEKFAVWTNQENKFLADGGIEKKFALEDLLDNVMIYWLTDSITTTMRLYAETFSMAQFALGLEKIPANVPVACVAAPNDLVYSPKSVLTYKYPQLVHYSHPPRGGHFMIFEEPALFADDVWSGMAKILESKRS